VARLAETAQEVTRAGARRAAEPMVLDGNLIASRIPDDIPQFSTACAEA
jgi:hypothetical protein